MSEQEQLVPLVRAAGELGLGYLAARNAALKGRLALSWKGSRMFVSRASVDRFKAERAAHHVAGSSGRTQRAQVGRGGAA